MTARHALAALTAAPAFCWAPQALACTSCMSGASGPMVDAARMGVWLLLGVVVAVEGAFAVFFLYLWRRARRMAGAATGSQVEAS